MDSGAGPSRQDDAAHAPGPAPPAAAPPAAATEEPLPPGWAMRFDVYGRRYKMLYAVCIVYGIVLYDTVKILFVIIIFIIVLEN